MADTVDLYVDLAELARVRDEVQVLLTSLTDLRTRREPPVTAEDMGSEDVADAVDRFRRRWSGVAERMSENLRSCVDYVDLALDQYARTERTLTDGLRAPATDARSAAP
jgi:hypothetical protein